MYVYILQLASFTRECTITIIGEVSALQNSPMLSKPVLRKVCNLFHCQSSGLYMQKNREENQLDVYHMEGKKMRRKITSTTLTFLLSKNPFLLLRCFLIPPSQKEKKKSQDPCQTPQKPLGLSQACKCNFLPRQHTPFLMNSKNNL